MNSSLVLIHALKTNNRYKIRQNESITKQKGKGHAINQTPTKMRKPRKSKSQSFFFRENFHKPKQIMTK
jgi:hypothetical protein